MGIFALCYRNLPAIFSVNASPPPTPGSRLAVDLCKRQSYMGAEQAPKITISQLGFSNSSLDCLSVEFDAAGAFALRGPTYPRFINQTTRGFALTRAKFTTDDRPRQSSRDLSSNFDQRNGHVLGSLSSRAWKDVYPLMSLETMAGILLIGLQRKYGERRVHNENTTHINYLSLLLSPRS
ncbi:hypothetical protein AB1N83_007367 [Pleurotus pulmonarius]